MEHASIQRAYSRRQKSMMNRVNGKPKFVRRMQTVFILQHLFLFRTLASVISVASSSRYKRTDKRDLLPRIDPWVASDHHQDQLFRDQSRCSKRFVTRFDDAIGSYGHMFNVRPVEGGEAIVLTGLEMYTDTEVELEYQLYTRDGTYLDALSDISGWEMLSEGNVTGGGKNSPTPLPLFPTPLPLSQGSTVGFYVTLKTADLRYRYGFGSGKEGDGQIQQANGQVEIWEGTGILTYPLGNVHVGPRMFLGVLLYDTIDDCPDNNDSSSDGYVQPLKPEIPDPSSRLGSVAYTFLVKHPPNSNLLRLVNEINARVEVAIQTLFVVDKTLNEHAANDYLRLVTAESLFLSDIENASACNIFEHLNVCSIVETVVTVSYSEYAHPRIIDEALLSVGDTIATFFSYAAEYIGTRVLEEDVDIDIIGISRALMPQEFAAFDQIMTQFLAPRFVPKDVVISSVQMTAQKLAAANKRRIVEIGENKTGLRTRRIRQSSSQLIKDIDTLTVTMRFKAVYKSGMSLQALFDETLDSNGEQLLQAFRSSSIGDSFMSASFVENLAKDVADDPIWKNTTVIVITLVIFLCAVAGVALLLGKRWKVKKPSGSDDYSTGNLLGRKKSSDQLSKEMNDRYNRRRRNNGPSSCRRSRGPRPTELGKEAGNTRSQHRRPTNGRSRHHRHRRSSNREISETNARPHRRSEEGASSHRRYSTAGFDANGDTKPRNCSRRGTSRRQKRQSCPNNIVVDNEGRAFSYRSNSQRVHSSQKSGLHLTRKSTESRSRRGRNKSSGQTYDEKRRRLNPESSNHRR